MFTKKTRQKVKTACDNHDEVEDGPYVPGPSTWMSNANKIWAEPGIMSSLQVNPDSLIAGSPESVAGIKYDMDKPDYSLIPPNALDDTVKILTLGAQKYARDNWRYVTNAKTRYFAAAMRHMWARMRGELKDPESGLDHCAHAICCLMFILELEHENLNP